MNFKQMKGFTLVELMVVVAIIGILSAIAIPNFKKYQSKAKTSEAKLQLAAIYAAEVAFQSDYDTFASCLPDMGFDPSLERPTRYYQVGFNAVSAQNVIATGNGASCTGAFLFAAGKTVAGGTAPYNAGFTGGGTYVIAGVGTTFIAAAEGVLGIGGAMTTDQWTMDELKRLRHRRVGY